ncbi:ABC transporter substrate-binding protein [Sodalis ligni]|nr:ABC transporter substrate-binding protein [Sodalis ligni]
MKIKTLCGLAMMAIFGIGQSYAADQLYVPVVSKGYQQEFWQTVKLGTEAAAKDLSVRTSFVGPSDETQIAEQIQLMEDTITRHPNGILLSSLDANALIPLVEKANGQHITVATFDSGVNSDIPVSFVATSNVKAGSAAADALAKELGGKGKVGIVAHVAGTTSAIERTEGFTKTIKEKYPNITLLPVQYSDGDPQKAMDKTIDMTRANPDLAGIYATNEGSTLGVANAIKTLGLSGKIKVIGFDSTEAIINYLKIGAIQGFIVQDAYQIGYQGLTTLVNSIRGQKVPKSVDIPVKFVTQSNLNEPAIQKLLYPFGKK